jgi:hypothetical protein
VATAPAVVRALGYTIAQLRTHLEAQFTRGMSWTTKRNGGVHLDHILPKRCFDLTTDEGVQAYWSLSNLRPVWRKENLRKAARVEFLL